MSRNAEQSGTARESRGAGLKRANTVVVIIAPEPVPGGRLPPWTALPVGVGGLLDFLRPPPDVPVVLVDGRSESDSPKPAAARFEPVTCTPAELAETLQLVADEKTTVWLFDGVVADLSAMPLDALRATAKGSRPRPLLLENDPAAPYEETVQLDENMSVLSVARTYCDNTEQADRGREIGLICRGDRLIAECRRDPRRPPRRPATQRDAGAPLTLAPQTVLPIPRSLGEYLALLGKRSQRWAAECGDEYLVRTRDVAVHRTARVDKRALIIGPVVIGRGARVGAANIMGPAVIAAGAQIEPSSTISRSVVLAGSKVERDCYLHESIVGAGETLEPASWLTGRLRLKRKTLQDTAPRPPESSGPFKFLPETPLSRFRTRLYEVTKRAMDIVGALIGLAVTLPFYPVIILLIKLTSRGPVFFVQRRQTRYGKTFPCLKFRTMSLDTEREGSELSADNECDGPQFYVDDDPRVTRFGNWMRRRNIDELPQLFNVLAGQMSLVGPRPLIDAENQLCPAWRKARLSVRAGMTGLWQVCRRDRREGDFHQWIYYDTEYVLNRSLWLDLRILWATMRLELMNFADVGPDSRGKTAAAVILPPGVRSLKPLVAWGCVLLVLLGIVYWTTIEELWTIWRNNDDYNHGPLIPVIAGGLIYLRRKDLRGVQIHPTWIGLVVLGFAFFLRFFGLYYWYNSLFHISMIVALIGLVLTVYGLDLLRRTFWALAFLFLMVPLPGAIDRAIIGPLQTFAASMAAWACDLAGIEVARQGNIVFVENRALEVARACSGLRLLYAFVALAWCVAYLSRRRPWEKVFVVLSSLPIAVAVNGLRVFAIGAILSWSHWRWSVESVHDAWAWLMMPLALLVLLLELGILNRLFIETEEKYDFSY